MPCPRPRGHADSLESKATPIPPQTFFRSAMPLAPEDPSTFTALVCAALAATIGALGIYLWRRVSGTTLAAPAAWVVVVAAFFAAVELPRARAGVASQ